MIAHPRKNPKFSRSEQDTLRILYYKIIYSDKKYEPGQTALEQILQISRIEDKYHEIGIYTEEDFWEAVFESAEAIKDGIYAFLELHDRQIKYMKEQGLSRPTCFGF